MMPLSNIGTLGYIQATPPSSGGGATELTNDSGSQILTNDDGSVILTEA